MKAAAAIALILCMIPAVCIVVWIGLHFAKQHIESKSAMSKAYYRRAREGIPNTADVELGPLNANHYTVQLAPYRYVKRNQETTFVRPTRDQRARRTKMNIRGTNYHVVENRPSSRKTVSAKPNHQSDHGSNRAEQAAKQSKKERKRQRQLQKQQQRQKAKEKEKHKEKEKEESNGWDHRSGNGQQSNGDTWNHQSNRGSNAEGRSQQQSQHSQHSQHSQQDAFQGQVGDWASYGQEEENPQTGNDWNENVQEDPPASHHGSGNAGWDNHENQNEGHAQQW
ncbi:hypothetical protein N7481_003319 [Penicillium waksmanii]|uniref:uncharacterized protein n=1 Tax=Penicillium waksmanii TaxID=69791 RepID=UPI002549233E|nr:uncharacterized protein N7481_003319 [Penicillium waksmanii]KAJ5988109.1 hypothetical protein N7481_003319 [Penicillium waksmanii]